MPKDLLNNLIERFSETIDRIQAIPLYEIAIEFLLFWIAIYLIVRFLRGTRGAGLIKGIGLVTIIAVLLIAVLGQEERFERLTFVYGNLLKFLTFALIIIFAPELRRAFMRLGEARLFRGGGIRKAKVIEELLQAAAYLSKNKIGALAAIERQVRLGGLIESGIPLDAEVSKELFNTIFWPGSALHDMGIVIRGDRIVAAGVQYPLAEVEEIAQELGARHRAAIGLSQECDALVLVISEETGAISLAERGKLMRDLTSEQLRKELVRGLGGVAMQTGRRSADPDDES